VLQAAQVLQLSEFLLYKIK
jgi:hypothetical protein